MVLLVALLPAVSPSKAQAMSQDTFGEFGDLKLFQKFEILTDLDAATVDLY